MNTEKDQETEQELQVEVEFTGATVMLNQSLCRLRMLTAKLGDNFSLIDTVYQKVSLGGMARQSSALVTELLAELETMNGLCWAAINAECDESRKLSFDEWTNLGSKPPAWLRDIFEGADILNGMPDEPSMVRIGEGQQVFVIRAPDLGGSGLLPQVAALMPSGFSLAATQIWWPWVMAGHVPVVLQTTDRANVLQEISSSSFLKDVGMLGGDTAA